MAQKLCSWERSLKLTLSHLNASGNKSDLSVDHNLIGPRQANLVLIASMRAAKVQASLRIRAVSPEPPLLAHTSSESRGTFRQKARSLAPLNGWACAVKICHDGMLEDTNSLDAAQLMFILRGALVALLVLVTKQPSYMRRLMTKPTK